MAGDLDLREEVVILGTRAEEVGVRAAMTMDRSAGRVLHRFGPRVMILEASEHTDEALRDTMRGASFGPTPSRLSEATRSLLDTTGSLGYAALRLRQGAAYRQAKSNRPLAGQAWDVAEAQRPDAGFAEEPHSPLRGALAADPAAASPTSAFLIGTVAVGLIFVEGPTEDLQFSEEEQAKVVAEVQNGLSWLGTQEARANVSWSYDIQIARLDTPPGPANLPGAELEQRWRDPAMSRLGYGPGLEQVRAYVQDLRSRLHTRWGYVAFFTKYPTGHFAYASLGGPRLVMQYSNDSWGPDNIDRVFAHESGHIFGAPDEYASSGCNCGGQWGYLKTPNNNCANCAEGGGETCIMRSNDWAMCSHTRLHLGWRDQDEDGVLDPDDPVMHPRWWLFRWLCRRYPSLCNFLSEPAVEEEEDLVPMSLLAQVLGPEDLERLETRIRQEQADYLETIAQHVEEASAELRSAIR